MSTARDVARALLGTWPNQVATWGEDALNAYIEELDARGLSPDAALLAIRSYDPDADFPPSAAKLASVARRDPSRPAALEIVAVLWGSGGVMHARSAYPEGGWRGPDGRRKADDAARLHAAVAHGPMVAAFVESVGIDALKNHDPADAEWGEANRRWLSQQWTEFQSRADERGVASLLAGRHLDPLGELRRHMGQRAIADVSGESS